MHPCRGMRAIFRIVTRRVVLPVLRRRTFTGPMIHPGRLRVPNFPRRRFLSVSQIAIYILRSCARCAPEHFECTSLGGVSLSDRSTAMYTSSEARCTRLFRVQRAAAGSHGVRASPASLSSVMPCVVVRASANRGPRSQTRVKSGSLFVAFFFPLDVSSHGRNSGRRSGQVAVLSLSCIAGDRVLGACRVFQHRIASKRSAPRWWSGLQLRRIKCSAFSQGAQRPARHVSIIPPCFF